MQTLTLTRTAALTATAAAAIGCGSPAAPTPASSPPVPQFTVSGTVFENVESGRQPLAAADIYRFIEAAGGGSMAHVATTDAQGRYVLTASSRAARWH